MSGGHDCNSDHPHKGRTEIRLDCREVKTAGRGFGHAGFQNGRNFVTTTPLKSVALEQSPPTFLKSPSLIRSALTPFVSTDRI